MAAFGDEWVDVPDAGADDTNVWGRSQSTLLTAAQLRSGAAMDTEKVAVLSKGARVRLLQRRVLESGALRVRVQDSGTGATGWCTSKMLAPPSELEAGSPSQKVEFVAGVTKEGVSFLRCRCGALVPDAETPVLVVLHGTSYNAGVWIPTFTALHEVWSAKGVGFEAWIVEWTGHGRSRQCPAGTSDPDIDVDRYELTVRGPDDIDSILKHGDCARAVASGRHVFAGVARGCLASLERLL